MTYKNASLLRPDYALNISTFNFFFFVAVAIIKYSFGIFTFNFGEKNTWVFDDIKLTLLGNDISWKRHTFTIKCQFSLITPSLCML